MIDIVKKKTLYGYTASKAQLSTKSTISRAEAEVTEPSFSILLPAGRQAKQAGGLFRQASKA